MLYVILYFCLLWLYVVLYFLFVGVSYLVLLCGGVVCHTLVLFVGGGYL